MHKHLAEYLNHYQLIHPLQSGFRQQHSCHTAITRITDTWLNAINRSEINGAIFLDLRKAFDMVDHELLLKKLAIYLANSNSNLVNQPTSNPSTHGTVACQATNTPNIPNALKFFRSYLTDRKRYVISNGAMSPLGTVKRGVPQGSVLGPVLFCLFINDLPLSIRDQEVACDMFADDATLHTSSKDISVISSRLQQGLDEVSNWCQHNSMALNPAKTESMVVTTRQRHQLKPLVLNLAFQSQNITQVSEHKLLGVTVDKELKWEAHINNVCKKVSKNVFMLSKLKDYVDINIRQIYFNAHIRSHLDYASTVWDGSSEVHLKRLNSLHRRAAKQILPGHDLSADQILDQLKMLPLKKHFLYNKAIFVCKSLKGKLPQYLTQFLLKQNPHYSARRNHLSVPLPNLDLYKTSISFSGPNIWNQLPQTISQACSLPQFKKGLHKWLLTACPN